MLCGACDRTASLCYKKGINLSDANGQVFSMALSKKEAIVKKLHISSE